VIDVCDDGDIANFIHKCDFLLVERAGTMLVEWLYVNKPSAKGLKKINPPAFGVGISTGLLGLLKLEVDIHRVAIASAKAARQRIDTGHALERREHGCVHDRVSAATNNIGAGYCPIFQNPNFHRANKRFILLED